MITEAMYKAYFGVDTAPTNLTRLEYLALNYLKTKMTSDVPVDGDDCYEDFLNALMEMINVYDENPDLTTVVTSTGATLGKYTEGTTSVNTNDFMELCPMAYNILLNCNLLYAGLC